MWRTTDANGSTSAEVTSQTDTDPWAKAGPMFRKDTNPGAPYYAVFVTPGKWRRGAMEERPGRRVLAGARVGTTPLYLKVTRAGTVFDAFTSSDGTTWTPITGASVPIPHLGGTILAGLAVCAHTDTELSTATMEFVSVG